MQGMLHGSVPMSQARGDAKPTKGHSDLNKISKKNYHSN